MQQPFSYSKGQYTIKDFDSNQYIQQVNRNLQRRERQLDKMEQAEQSRIDQQNIRSDAPKAPMTSIDPADPIDWAVLIERAILIRSAASTNTASMALTTPTIPKADIIPEANTLPTNTIQAKEPMQNEEKTSSESSLIRGEASETIGQTTYSNSTTLAESTKEIPTILTPGATINSTPTAPNTTTLNPRESTASSPKIEITTSIPIEATTTIPTIEALGPGIPMLAARIMPTIDIAPIPQATKPIKNPTSPIGARVGNLWIYFDQRKHLNPLSTIISSIYYSDWG
ncbi:hypothetical protein V8E54_005814 [Elaphomyces granulatus]